MSRTLVVVLLASLALLVTQSRPPSRRFRETDLRPVLLRPGVVSLLARSQRPLLIDLLWLRALNAIGEAESERKNRALFDYATFLTDLDPRFYQVYFYLGMNVSALTATGWANADLANEVFERGLAQFPKDLRLHLCRAGNLFFGLKDYERASAAYLEASRLDDAPAYLAPLAVRLRAQRDPTQALAFARSLLAETTNDFLREDLEKKIRVLEIEVVVDEVDRAVEAFKSARGRAPYTMDELLQSRLYEGPAQDPTGAPLTIGPDGRAHSPALDSRLKLFHVSDDEGD